MSQFELQAQFKPTGDQPQAIEKLVAGLNGGLEHQVLLGVTGSGKTFTMANVIEKIQRPTLVISHNKTLAAQLFQEFREFFPQNAVHYFVSYYDYYQPEAYVPQRDLYIEKEAEINEKIEIMRHSATEALMTRQDVIVVASVSCIYGLGRPEDYAGENLELQVENPESRRGDVLRNLIRLLYQRNDWDFKRGCFRVRGDTVEVFPPYGERVLRLEFLGDDLKQIQWVAIASGEVLENLDTVAIFPAGHFITPEDRMRQSVDQIRQELAQRYSELSERGKALEAYRLKQRTEYDLELITELGFCPGIENYSLYLTGRKTGEAPYTLLDYFERCGSENKYGRHGKGSDPKIGRYDHVLDQRAYDGHKIGSDPKKNWLCIIDESHMTVPQIRGMYNGDQARKEVLIDYGFRLPSALDNRPLQFDEFLERVPQVVYTSATPADWEIAQAQRIAAKSRRSHSGATSNPAIESDARHPDPDKSGEGSHIRLYRPSASSGLQGGNPPHNGIVEQLIRPTGLLDPEIEIRPINNQIRDLVGEIVKRQAQGERTLVTTLTKRMAEELSDYLADPDKISELTGQTVAAPIKAQYLHSDVKTLERSDILADLRRGKYDVVVGINLLREGLDLPEVSLVAILDADKEGFLRSETSLIQTMGRAARHVHGKVILYADNITGSIDRAIREVDRRRKIQELYNRAHGITPESIQKPVRERIVAGEEAEKPKKPRFEWELLPPEELENKIWEWEREMRQAAEVLDFEKAAEYRDLIRAAKNQDYITF